MTTLRISGFASLLIMFFCALPSKLITLSKYMKLPYLISLQLILSLSAPDERGRQDHRQKNVTGRNSPLNKSALMKGVSRVVEAYFNRLTRVSNVEPFAYEDGWSFSLLCFCTTVIKNWYPELAGKWTASTYRESSKQS